jgi:linoleoyl-CoA desaturase
MPSDALAPPRCSQLMRVATYLPKTAVARQLQERVDQYFAETGKSRRDVPAMYLKTAIIMGWLTASYVSLVFFVTEAWQAVLVAISLGLAKAAVGFNIQHDGNHGSYSQRPWVNRMMSLTLDLLGGTAYYWHFKHNIAHHTHPNIVDQDDDISLGVLGRISPHQKWYPAHQLQVIYIWLIYSVFAMQWQLGGEFRNLVAKRWFGSTHVPVPRGTELAIFWLGKVVFFFLAFGLPLTRHSVGNVLGAYAICAMTLGLVLALTFQIAHCSDASKFRAITPDDHVVPRSWVEHQVETTVDFCRQNRLVSWYMGGLNFQIEHHLFPKICHVHYPALAPIVEEVCLAHGLPYYSHPTLWAALCSHLRQLHAMGKRPVAEPVEVPAATATAGATATAPAAATAAPPA